MPTGRPFPSKAAAKPQTPQQTIGDASRIHSTGIAEEAEGREGACTGQGICRPAVVAAFPQGVFYGIAEEAEGWGRRRRARAAGGDAGRDIMPSMPNQKPTLEYVRVVGRSRWRFAVAAIAFIALLLTVIWFVHWARGLERLSTF